MQQLKKFARYAIPSVASMWVFSIYTMVDGIFVARGVNSDALAAVNISLPFVNLMFAVGLIIATGTSTIVSITIGRGEGKRAKEIFSQNIVVACVLGGVFTALALIFLNPLLIFLGAAGATLEYARQYVGTIAWFAIFFIVSYNLEVQVKVDGAPHISTIGVTSCALMNVVLDYLFVMVFNWGVGGAALATGIAQATSTLIFALYFLFRGKKLRLTRFKPNPGIYRRIIPVGLADGITELSNGVIILLFNRTILALAGEGEVACYTVVSYINTLVLMTMSGIAQGMQPLTSLHFGMGDKAGVRRFLKYGIVSAIGLSAVFFAASQLGGAGVARLFFDASDPLLPYTADALRLFSVSFLMVGVNVVAAAYFASIERSKVSLFISFGRGLALLALSLLAMSRIFGMEGVWLAPAVSEGVCLIFSAIMLASVLGKSKGKKTKPL